jgi:hypothetical protein
MFSSATMDSAYPINPNASGSSAMASTNCKQISEDRVAVPRMPRRTYPLLIDHITDGLHSRVYIVLIEIEYNSKRSDTATSVISNECQNPEIHKSAYFLVVNLA